MLVSIYVENLILKFIYSHFLLPLESGETDDKSSVDNKKNQRRKGKVHEIKEDTQITNDFASKLDLSCMSKGLVKAPTINNGNIAKYNR